MCLYKIILLLYDITQAEYCRSSIIYIYIRTCTRRSVLIMAVGRTLKFKPVIRTRGPDGELAKRAAAALSATECGARGEVYTN
jgi:hypothetical protein